MDEYVCLSAMKPRANPTPGLAEPIKVGQTMCGKNYYPSATNIVDHQYSDEVTCPKCREKMSKFTICLLANK